MKKIILSIIVVSLLPAMAMAKDKESSEPERKPMTAGELFKLYDANGDGAISKMEFLEAQPVMPPLPPHQKKDKDKPLRMNDDNKCRPN